jgi:hypothetical protein
MMWHGKINLLHGYRRHCRDKTIFAVLFIGALLALMAGSACFEAYKLLKLDGILLESRRLDQSDRGTLETALQQDYREKLFWEEIRRIDAGVFPFATKIRGILDKLPQSVQIESLEISKPGQLLISGLAATGEDCVSYYRQLAQDLSLTKVVLLQADRQFSGFAEVDAHGYRFVIQAEMVE